MECAKAAEIIASFCDTKSSYAEEKELLQHLDQCELCRDFVKGVEHRLRSGCDGDTDEENSSEVLKVVSKIIQEFHPGSHPRR